MLLISKFFICILKTGRIFYGRPSHNKCIFGNGIKRLMRIYKTFLIGVKILPEVLASWEIIFYSCKEFRDCLDTLCFQNNTSLVKKLYIRWHILNLLDYGSTEPLFKNFGFTKKKSSDQIFPNFIFIFISAFPTGIFNWRICNLINTKFVAVVSWSRSDPIGWKYVYWMMKRMK